MPSSREQSSEVPSGCVDRHRAPLFTLAVIMAMEFEVGPIILQCFRTFVIACVRMFDQPVCHSNKPMFGTEVTGASFVSARRHPVFADDSLTDTKILWTFFDWRKVPVAFDPLPDSSGNLFGGFRLYGSTIRSAQLLPGETYRSSIDAEFLDAPLHISPRMLRYPFGKAK